jgi:DNA-binding transcriptional ArsR family regulator
MSNQSAAAKHSTDVHAILDALGDHTRRDIVEQLQAGPLSVGRLAAALPVGRPAVSKHLRVLEGAGLVEHRSVGTRNLYALAPGGLATLQVWLAQTWDSTLGAFAARVAEKVAGQAVEKVQAAAAAGAPNHIDRTADDTATRVAPADRRTGRG